MQPHNPHRATVTSHRHSVLTLRCLSLAAASGKSYSARFPTQQGYQSIRLPFTVFRPMDPFDEGFDVKASPIVQMTLRRYT